MNSITSGEVLTQIVVKETTLDVQTEDGQWHSTPLAWYPTLLRMPENERRRAEIDETGFGIEWPGGFSLGIYGILEGRKEGGEYGDGQLYTRSIPELPDGATPDESPGDAKA
jgi:Protein of unknown function (DUF2442)